MNTTQIQAKIEHYEARLVQVESAIETVLCGGQSYSLDSGQTRQTVTRSTLGELRKTEEYLNGKIESLESKLGSGSFYARTAF